MRDAYIKPMVSVEKYATTDVVTTSPETTTKIVIVDGGED